MVDIEPYGDLVVGVDFGTCIAAQRMCCEQTVLLLLVPLLMNSRLSLSNKADSRPCREYCASLMQITFLLVALNPIG